MMSKMEQIANLVSECLDRCRESGFTLATPIYFLDEMRENGQPEVDVQRVDGVMRQILKDILVPGESLPIDLSEASTLVPLAALRLNPSRPEFRQMTVGQYPTRTDGKACRND